VNLVLNQTHNFLSAFDYQEVSTSTRPTSRFEFSFNFRSSECPWPAQVFPQFHVIVSVGNPLGDQRKETIQILWTKSMCFIRGEQPRQKVGMAGFIIHCVERGENVETRKTVVEVGDTFTCDHVLASKAESNPLTLGSR
jgi:hypothetical protein